MGKKKSKLKVSKLSKEEMDKIIQQKKSLVNGKQQVNK